MSHYIPDISISLHSLFQQCRVAFEATEFHDVDLVVELKSRPVLRPTIALALEEVSVVCVILFLSLSSVLFECLTGRRNVVMLKREKKGLMMSLILDMLHGHIGAIINGN